MHILFAVTLFCTTVFCNVLSDDPASKDLDTAASGYIYRQDGHGPTSLVYLEHPKEVNAQYQHVNPSFAYPAAKSFVAHYSPTTSDIGVGSSQYYAPHPLQTLPTYSSAPKSLPYVAQPPAVYKTVQPRPVYEEAPLLVHKRTQHPQPVYQERRPVHKILHQTQPAVYQERPQTHNRVQPQPDAYQEPPPVHYAVQPIVYKAPIVDADPDTHSQEQHGPAEAYKAGEHSEEDVEEVKKPAEDDDAKGEEGAATFKLIHALKSPAPDHHKKHTGRAHDEKHFNKKGHKTNTNFNKETVFSKGDKGKHDIAEHVGHYDEQGAHKGGKYEAEDSYAEAHKGEKAAKGGKFGEKKHHKKGSKTTGYHNVFHKDEYKKDHTFYDEADHRGHFDNYGSDHGYHSNDAVKHKKGVHHHTGNHEDHYGKKGHTDKGYFDEEDTGYQKKHGHDVHHAHEHDYAEKGGKKHGSEHKFAEHGGRR